MWPVLVLSCEPPTLTMTRSTGRSAKVSRSSRSAAARVGVGCDSSARAGRVIERKGGYRERGVSGHRIGRVRQRRGELLVRDEVER